jgi:epoxide hydrolase-like predicted phosphatase
MKKLEGVKNLLFDFGGVIINIEKAGAVKRFKEIGVDKIEEYLGEFRQEGIFLALEEGKLSREDFYDEFRKLAGKNISNADIDSGWMAFLTGIPEYKFQLLEELRKDYNLLLLSNTNSIIMEWGESKEFSPSGKSISAYFDQVFFSYKIGYTKPDKEAFEIVLKESGIKAEETLFLDDGQSNLDTAEQFGFKTYLVDQNEDLRKVFE